MRNSEIWHLAGGTTTEDLGAWAAEQIRKTIGGVPIPRVNGRTVAIVGTGPSLAKHGLADQIDDLHPAVVVGLNESSGWVARMGMRRGWRTVGRFQDWTKDDGPAVTAGLDHIVALAGYSPAKIPGATVMPNPYPIGPMGSAVCALIDARASFAARVVFFACDSVAGNNRNIVNDANDGAYRRHAILAALAAGNFPVEWRCPEPDKKFHDEVKSATTARIAVHAAWIDQWRKTGDRPPTIGDNREGIQR